MTAKLLCICSPFGRTGAGIVGDVMVSAAVVNVPLHEPSIVASLAVSVTLIE